jgi:putative methyltransferase
VTKRRIYLAQVNTTYGRNAFLPYSVGLLQAYAQQDPVVREHYDFAGYLYLREPVADVVARMDAPDVFGASCYIWNFEYSMALIRAVRDRFPACLIVLGGPHVPVRSADFFRSHAAADLLVHYEGEVTFHEILLERLNAVPDYTRIAGLSVKLPNGETHKTPNRERIADLAVIPSPYLTGVFDDLMIAPYDFHGSQETNRGCPYSCTYCDWGSNIMAKVKPFPADRLVAEFEWFARHEIDLLYNCDANYGIFPRDLELTREMAAVKARTGFPKKFRAAYAKNSNEKVFAIARTLHAAGMSKGVTLSFQSMNEPTLKLVKRHNIKIDSFSDLSRRYRAEGIATYSEFIIGLPGETYDTFADGLDTAIRAGQHDSLQVYTCEVLPNSEMSNPEYVAAHRIETVRTPALFVHSTPPAVPLKVVAGLVLSTKLPPVPLMIVHCPLPTSGALPASVALVAHKV